MTSQIRTFREIMTRHNMTPSGVVVNAIWTLLDKSPKQSLHPSVAVEEVVVGYSYKDAAFNLYNY